MRDLAVDEVEDVGDDHDDAGQDEAGPCAERDAAAATLMSTPTKRQDVRVDPKRHARRDDRAQREHADAPDERR